MQYTAPILKEFLKRGYILQSVVYMIAIILSLIIIIIIIITVVAIIIPLDYNNNNNYSGSLLSILYMY